MVIPGKEHSISIQLLSYFTSHPDGANINEIAKDLGLNRNNVAKYLSALNLTGLLELWIEGNTKVYRLAHRVPSHIFSLYLHGEGAGMNPSLLVKETSDLIHKILVYVKSSMIDRLLSSLSYPPFRNESHRSGPRNFRPEDNIDPKLAAMNHYPESHEEISRKPPPQRRQPTAFRTISSN